MSEMTEMFFVFVCLLYYSRQLEINMEGTKLDKVLYWLKFAGVVSFSLYFILRLIEKLVSIFAS